MKKEYPYSAVSTKKCNVRVGWEKGRSVYCEKPLKLRLVEAKAPHNITRCYQHHMATKQA